MVERKMKKERTRPEGVDWVKIQGQGCICLRCGGTHTFVLPMSVDNFAKVIKAFVALHSYCVEQLSPATE